MPNSKYILSSIVPKLKNQTTGFAEDESPFNIYTLDPRNTFVVYYSGLGEYPVMGVKYVVKKDYSVIFSVYTPTQYFELESSSASSAGRITKVEPNVLGMIPIIEYPMNNARLGAFEVVLPLLDAINLVQSNRLDGIEQFIQSLVVLVNAEIEDGKESAIRNAGLISLKTFGDLKQDIKIISEQLDQAQTQVLIDYMYQTVLNIVGMPNRNGGNSTSDTGSAVIMRDGWESAEARAKSAELMIKEPERNYLLKAALRIMRDTVGTPLKLSDIEIKFTRRNYENILSKSQVLTSMLANDKIAPILAFTHCGLFSDPEDAAKMSAEHHANVLAKASATEKESQTKEGVAIA
jgi:SPP1 family phage portal protein